MRVHLGKAAHVSVLDCVYAVQSGMNHFYLSSAHQTPPPPPPRHSPPPLQPPPLSMHHLLPNCFPSLVTLRLYLKTLSPCFSSFPLCVCSFHSLILFHSLTHTQTYTHNAYMHTQSHSFTHVRLDLISVAVSLAGRKKKFKEKTNLPEILKMPQRRRLSSLMPPSLSVSLSYQSLPPSTCIPLLLHSPSPTPCISEAL